MAIKVQTIEQAWDIAKEIFPTKFRLDNSIREGEDYDTYVSTQDNVDDWIEDHHDWLELHLNGGRRIIYINVDKSKKNYKVAYQLGDNEMSFITQDISVAYEVVAELAEEVKFPIDKTTIMETLVKMKNDKTISFKHGNFKIEKVQD